MWGAIKNFFKKLVSFFKPVINEVLSEAEEFVKEVAKESVLIMSTSSFPKEKRKELVVNAVKLALAKRGLNVRNYTINFFVEKAVYDLKSK